MSQSQSGSQKGMVSAVSLTLIPENQRASKNYNNITVQWIIVNEGKVIECSFNHTQALLEPAEWDENGESYILKDAVVRFTQRDVASRNPADPIVILRRADESDSDVMKMFNDLDGLVNPKPIVPVTEVPIQQ